MLKTRQYANELADIIQEKYLHLMYGLRTSCVSHNNETDDLKLLVGLYNSGINCQNRPKCEVKELPLPHKHFNSNNLLP